MESVIHKSFCELISFPMDSNRHGPLDAGFTGGWDAAKPRGPKAQLFTPSNSTSKMSVAFGGMSLPTPWSP
jgi:hypothetical protein